MANPNNNSVFISYSLNDRQACVILQSALEQAGFAVFRDEESIRKGDRWITRLEEALKGCTAFVVLIGRDGVRRWVGAEVQVALIRHLSPHDDTQRLPIFPVLLEDTKPEALPPFLSLFQANRWSAAEPLPHALIDDIRNRAIRYEAQPVFDGCPFLGLSAFKREHANLFFGRRAETLAALACLGDQQQSNPEHLQSSNGANYHRWLQIEGNSGSGKSSLVRAGMLPMIELGALWARTGFDHWRVLPAMMPGKDPITKLAEVIELGLVAEGHRKIAARVEELQGKENALALALRGFKEEGAAFLLIVDQFEELFTFAETNERKQFDAQLAHALQDPECPLFLISTVRADFLDRYELLPRLAAIYNSHCKRYFLPTISEQGLREVIEQPARLAGLDVRDVAELIRADARDEIGVLPLVENALDTLWRQREGNRLSADRYRQQNGIAGMLSAQADALLERIAAIVPKGKQAALELLLRLTRSSDEGRHTRQRITRAEAVMAAGDGVGEQVVRLLSGERSLDAPSASHHGALRLITINQEQQQQYVDLIHETLIRARGKDEKSGKRIGYWPTLYDYIENNRDRDIHRQQLEFRAERWQQSKGLGRLWRLAYTGLGDYRALRIPPHSPEGQFLKRSRWAQRGILAVLVVLLSYVVESLYTTKQLGLPMESMWTLQRFRLGYAPLPTFVSIEPGSFKMGEQDTKFRNEYGEDDRKYWGAPIAPVAIEKDFSLGVTEVTFEHFDYYIWARPRGDGDTIKAPSAPNSGRGTRPVVNISWHEAMAYAAWLGARTKQNCRLPSEAEWEFAARAGSDRAYPWGDEVGENKASCRGCGGPRGKGEESAPVGSFAPNPSGLKDTSGNVWEWTCSMWRDEFDGEEQKCADPKDTTARVLRGGSWFGDAASARSAARYSFNPDNRSDSFGFRVLCVSPIE